MTVPPLAGAIPENLADLVGNTPMVRLTRLAPACEAELRRAITDTQPLGPREEGDLNPDASGDALMHGDVLDGSRLGSLLRRRR